MTREQSALALLKTIDAKMGRFYDALTDTLVSEMDAINGKALAKLLERLDKQLDRDDDGRIARTSKNLTRLSTLDEDYVKVMDKYGHRKAIAAFVGEFPKQLPSLAEQLNVISGQLKRGPLNVKEILAAPKVQDMLSAQQNMTIEDMHSAAARVAVQAKRKVMLQYAALDRTATAEMLHEQLGRTIGETRTLGATGMAMFHRVAHDKVMDVVDPDKALLYVYDGPDDKLTRPFCQAMKAAMKKGKTWTRAEIDKMENGQLADVFTTGGGYNCRHQFRLALDDELPQPTAEELAEIAAKEEAARVAAEAKAKAEEEARLAAEAAAKKAAEEEAERKAAEAAAALAAEEEARQKAISGAKGALAPHVKQVAKATILDQPPPVLSDAAYEAVDNHIATLEQHAPGAYQEMLDAAFANEQTILDKKDALAALAKKNASAAYLGGPKMTPAEMKAYGTSFFDLEDLEKGVADEVIAAETAKAKAAAAEAKAKAEAEALAKAKAEAEALAKAQAEAEEKAKMEALAKALAAAVKAKAEAEAAAKIAAEAAAKQKAIADTKAALDPHLKNVAAGHLVGGKDHQFSPEELMEIDTLQKALEALEPGAYQPLVAATIADAQAAQLAEAKKAFTPLYEKKALKVNNGKLTPDELKIYLAAADVIKGQQPGHGDAALAAAKKEIDDALAPVINAKKAEHIKAQLVPLMQNILKGGGATPDFQSLASELHPLDPNGMADVIDAAAKANAAADKLEAAKAKAKPLLMKDTLNQSLTTAESAEWAQVMKDLDALDPIGIETLQKEIKAELAAAEAAAQAAAAAAQAAAAKAAAKAAKKAAGGRADGYEEWETPMTAQFPAFDPTVAVKEMHDQFYKKDGSATKMDPVSAKVEVCDLLYARLKDNADWKTYAKSAASRFSSNPGATPELKVISGMVNTWARTSADHDELSLAVQQAVALEFNSPYPTFLSSSYAHDKAKKFMEANEVALRAFARAMYDNTQEYFKKNNIKSVWGYRGMKDVVPADWTAKLAKDNVGFGDAKVGLQPASSFSANYTTSYKDFANSSTGCVIAAEIPVERIMGCCRSGFGCLDETEYVVLAATPTQAKEDKFFTHAWTSYSGRGQIATPQTFVDMTRQYAISQGDPNAIAGAAQAKATPKKIQIGKTVYDLQHGGGGYLSQSGTPLSLDEAQEAMANGQAWAYNKPAQIVMVNGEAYHLKGSGQYQDMHGNSIYVDGSPLSSATFNKSVAKGLVQSLPETVKDPQNGAVYTQQPDGTYLNAQYKLKMSANGVGMGLKDGYIEDATVVAAPAPAVQKISYLGKTYVQDLDPHGYGDWFDEATMNDMFPQTFSKGFMNNKLTSGDATYIAAPAPAPAAKAAATVMPDKLMLFGDTFTKQANGDYKDQYGTHAAANYIKLKLDSGDATPVAAPAPKKAMPDQVKLWGDVYTKQANGSYNDPYGTNLSDLYIQSKLDAGDAVPHLSPAAAKATTKIAQTHVAKPLLVKQEKAVTAAKVMLSKGKKLVDNHVQSLHSMTADQVDEAFSTAQQNALLNAGVLQSWQVNIVF